MQAVSFQGRVNEWVLACFGPEIARDQVERNHRFLEEALELVQSLGCSQSEAHQLVDYVFTRPVGEPAQEAGGTLVTLAALLNTARLDMKTVGDVELERVWTKVEAIRAKQAAKPKHSPLPQASIPAVLPLTDAVKEVVLLAIFEAMHGEGDSSDYKYHWLNWFTAAERPGVEDTFNRCHSKGWLETTHDTYADVSRTKLTPEGRAHIAAARGEIAP